MGRPNEKDVLRPYYPSKALPSQTKFHEALTDTDSQFVLYMGGVGCGKTRAAVEQGIYCSLTWPGNVGVVGRLYATDLETSTKRAYIERLDEMAAAGGLHYEEVKSERLLKIYFHAVDKPSLIYFWPLEESFRLGSTEIGWFHIEEAAELRDDQAFTRLKHRLRFNWQMPPLGKAGMQARITLDPRPPYKRMGFLTANPPDEDHWLATWFPEAEMVDEGKAKTTPGHLLVQANSYENRSNLPEGYIENLERTMSESWKRVYLMGKYGFLRAGKPVYDDFSEELHVKKLEWNKYLPMLRAWDFGYTHPCVLWGQIDNNGRLFILREHQGADILLDDWISVVLARSNEWFPGAQFKDCCDIAGTQSNDKSDRTSIQTLESRGINPSARRCSTQINGPDILRVQRLIKTLQGGKPALMVDESCKLVVRGLSGGYQRSNKDSNKPEEDGFYEHSMDCLKYLCANFLESDSVRESRSIEIQGPRWW